MAKIRTKLLLLLFLLLGVSLPAKAQFTVVNATVLDPNGSPYAGCSGSASFVPSPSATLAPTISGSTFPTVVVIAACDSFGKFTLTLVDNNQVSDGHTSPPASQWNFAIQSQDGKTGFNCVMTITGASQDISSALQACAPILPASAGGGGAFVVKPIPCASSMTFTLAGVSPTTANTAFTTTLNCNVASTSVVAGSGNVQVGAVAQFTLIQDAVGGRTFNWPSNFIDQPTVQIAPLSTTNASFYFDGIAWHAQTFPASGSSSGGNPAAPEQAVQFRSNSQFAGSSNFLYNSAGDVLDVGNLSTLVNPYVDVTRYGVRSIANAAPAAPGITGSINSGTNALTVSASSCAGQAGNVCFVKGDGVSVVGAGATQSMSTPAISSVTPSVSTSLPGVAWSVGAAATAAGPAGTNTDNYCVVARDIGGGFTACSATGSTTTAQTLGYQTVGISSMTRSGVTVTVTTSAPHGLAVGTAITFGGTITPIDFYGWYTVASVPDNTHFTYIGAMDTGAGAATSATLSSATVAWWNCNHVVWNAVTGAYLYYIYSDRQNPGTFSLIGVSLPAALYGGIAGGGTATNPFWDDYGHTMNDGQLFPYYIPTTAPSSPQNDNLSTTITAGAGTTSLTLAANAGTTVSGATVLFDNAPNILAAQTAARSNSGMIQYPTGQYIINSSFTMDASNSLTGSLILNDTVALNSESQLDSHVIRNSHFASPPFGWEAGASVGVNHANPGFAIASGGQNLLRGLLFTYSGTNQRGIVVEACAQCQFEYLQFQRNVNDYTGIDMDVWQAALVNGTFFNTFRYMLFSAQQGLTGAATPTLAFHGWANGMGKTDLYDISMSARGIYFEGPEVYLRGGRDQAGSIPVMTLGGAAQFRCEQFDQDTMGNPLVVNFGGSGSSAQLEHCGTPAGPLVSGKAFGSISSVGFGITGTNINIVGSPLTANWAGIKVTSPTANLNTNTGGANSNGQGSSVSVGYAMALPVAPTVAPAAGGAIATGTYYVSLEALDALGNATSPGAVSSGVTLTTGNQNILVTFPAAQPGQVSWNICVGTINSGTQNPCGLGGGTGNLNNIPISNATWTVTGLPSNSPNQANYASISGIGSVSVFSPEFDALNSGFKAALKAGTLTAGRTQTFPDNTGTVANLNLAQTWTDHQSILNGKSIRWFSTNGTNYAGFTGGASTSNLVWLFPTTDSSGTQCLSSNGSLQLSWSACSGGTGTPGGSNTQVQFNNSSSFGGSTNLTWVSPTLSIGSSGTTGQLSLVGGTSGNVTLTSQAAAGTPTVTFGTSSGTPAVTASAPLGITAATGNITCATCTTNAAALTNNLIVLGAGSQATQSGPAGTTTTVLHGNAAGAPSYAAVDLVNDTTSTLTIAKGGTGQTTANAAFNALTPMTTEGDLEYFHTSAGTRLAVGSNGQCLTSNGTDPAWGSCAAGAVGGSGTAGLGTFWNTSTTVTSSNNWAYSPTGGHIVTQGSNATDIYFGKRFTDTSPLGNFLNFLNAAANSTLFKVDINGNLTTTGSISSLSSTAGTIQLGQGTAPGLVANALQLIAPASVTAAGEQFAFPGTPGTGVLRFTNSSGAMAGSLVSASGVGSCANTVVTAVNDNAAPSCSPVVGADFGSQTANTFFAAPNGSAGNPAFRAIVAADLLPINLASSANGGVSGVLGFSNGGTNATSAASGFNNLSPMTTLGDTIYGGSSPAGGGARLAGNTSATKMYLTQTGNGSVSAAPAWAQGAFGDLSGTATIGQGGTGQTTASAAFNALSPMTTLGDTIYGGTSGAGTRLAGNTTASTLCLTQTGNGSVSAAPVWGSCAGAAGTAWSSLTNPSGNLSLSMTANTTTFTWGNATGSAVDMFKITDTASNTGTGFALNINLASSSAAKPFQAAVNGNGVSVSNAGVLAKVGTGSITADTLNLNVNTTSPLTGGGALSSSLTVACATCVTSASALTNNALVIGSGGGQGAASLANGTAKQVAIAGTPLSYIDFPDFHYFPAADCVNAVGASGWSTGATPVATCRAGTNNKEGFLGPWGASDTAQFSIALPADWDTATNPNVRLRLASTDTTSGHTVIMQIATACSKGDGSTTDDVAFNTAQSLGTITLNTTANQQWDATLTNITMTGCVAGGVLRLKLSRTTDTATNVEVYGLGITIPRLLTVQAN